MNQRLYMRFVAVVIALMAVTTANGQEKSKRQDEAGVVSLDVHAMGNRIDLLIGRKQAGQTAKLEYLRSGDGGEMWTEPVAVGEGQPAPDPVHRGMDAQIAAAGDRVVAVWTTRADTRMGRGPLASAISEDGGKTWKPGPSPSDSGEIIDHAFVDIAVDAKGVFHCVWLDGRGGIAGKGLRYAQSSDGGTTWSKNVTLDPTTCECCWNKISVSGEMVSVLYRDKEPRDMAMIQSSDAGKTWGKAVTVGAFGWMINGCPHVGGGLASAGDSMYAVVWTAKGEPDRGAFVPSSSDSGATWSRPAQLGNSQSWHPDVAVKNGMVAACWDAYSDGGAAAFVSLSTQNDWSAPRQISTKGATASMPRIVAVKNAFRVFWTERSQTGPTTWVSTRVGF